MKWLRVGAVIFVSVVITTLGIDAADTLTGVRTTLLGQLASTEHTGCLAGMVSVSMGQTFECADVYEVSPGPDCPHSDPKNQKETIENLASPECTAVAIKGAIPWRFITRDQAVTACLKTGKRLLSSNEWFTLAAGTPDTGACNTDTSGAHSSGAKPQCVSGAGVMDTIGNVWEWTTDDVISGTYQGRPVPETGYVTQVDAGGFPVLTSHQSSALFFDDYFWSASEGAHGVLRGGFYGSGSDAGVYVVHAATLPTAFSAAIGFRCVL